MGIAAGCSGHGLAVARRCVTGDYVRAAASSVSRRAQRHLRTTREDFYGASIRIFSYSQCVTLQCFTKRINHCR